MGQQIQGDARLPDDAAGVSQMSNIQLAGASASSEATWASRPLQQEPVVVVAKYNVTFRIFANFRRIRLRKLFSSQATTAADRGKLAPSVRPQRIPAAVRQMGSCWPKPGRNKPLKGERNSAIDRRSMHGQRQAYLNRLGIHQGGKGQRQARAVLRSRDKFQAVGSDGLDAACRSTSEEISRKASLGSEDFRSMFLRKLSYEKVWVPPVQQELRHSTVIIFDWDDTLLPTTYIERLKNRGHCELATIKQHVNAVGIAARALLEVAHRMGPTFIITNAVDRWVQDSAAAYIPDIVPVLATTEVISAQHQYKADHPDDVGAWKLHAFLDLQRRLGDQAVTNFVVVGDAKWEMEAARAIGNMYPKAIVKKVKFREMPSSEELLQELTQTVDKFPKIFECGQGMEVSFQPKMQPRPKIEPGT